MNNWIDSLAVHYSRQLYAADSDHFGPYLAKLHTAADWSTNQIDGAMAFFAAESPRWEQDDRPRAAAELV